MTRPLRMCVLTKTLEKQQRDLIRRQNRETGYTVIQIEFGSEEEQTKELERIRKEAGVAGDTKLHDALVMMPLEYSDYKFSLPKSKK